MTAITYIASRNMAKKDFSVSATDISIASTDNSFNSAGGDFLGMLAAEWIYVLNSAADDGWHQLDSDSTAAKIIVISTLADESAGSLISVEGYYHGPAAQYDLETASHVMNESIIASTNSSESLSGVTETLFLKENTFWDITTDYILEADMKYWREFISSVRAGEEFTFDAYGTIAAPDSPVACILVGDPTITRVSSTKTYQISIKVKVK